MVTCRYKIFTKYITTQLAEQSGIYDDPVRLKGEDKRSEGGGIVASADELPLIAAAVRRVAERVEKS